MPRVLWRLWGALALLWGAACAPAAPDAPLPEALPTLTPEVTPVEVFEGAPRALRWLPEGPQEAPVRAVAVTFDRPMAPEARIKLSPPTQGEQRWVGPQTLLLTFDPALPRSSHFVATVTGARGAAGEPLARAPLWTFSTARPVLVGVDPPLEEALPEPAQALTLTWNQPVALASLQERLGLSIQSDRHRAVPFQLACASDAQGREDCARVLVTPRAPYPPGARVFVTLQAGVQGLEGRLPSERAWKHSATTLGRARARPARPAPPPPAPLVEAPVEAPPRPGPLFVDVHAERGGLVAWLRGPRALTRGARVALRGGDGALLWEGRADEDGIAALPWLGRWGAPAPWRVIAGEPGADASTTLPDGPLAQPAPADGALFVPDARRDPGEPVYLAGALPGAARAALRLESPDRKQIVSLSVATDAAGRFDAAPRVPLGAAPGRWRVVAAPDGPGGALEAEVQVGAPAAAPPGGLQVRLSAQELAPQEPLYVDITAVGAARWEARRSWSPLRSSALPGFVFGEQREAADAPQVSTGRLTPGAGGAASLTLLATEGARRDGPEALVVRAWDARGGEAEARALRHTASRYLGLQVRPRLARPGERVTVRLVAASPEGAPLAQVPARVTLERWGEEGWREVAVCRVKTQAAPSVCGFAPSAAGRWRIMARGEGDAQEATASAPLWVLGEGAALGASDGEVSVALDRDLWGRGERGLALLRAPWPRADLLVTLDFGEGGERRALLRDAPGWAALPVEIPEAATRAELRLSAASGGREVAAQVVPLPLQGAAPGLAMEARLPALAPGERARLHAQVTRQGRPAEALVSAALIDPEGRALSLWRGAARTDAQGAVSLPVEAPDLAGRWRLEVFARDAQGRSARLSQEVRVQSPLEVLIEAPPTLREGDALPVALGLRAEAPGARAAARVWAEPAGALAVEGAPEALVAGERAVAQVRALRAGPARLCVEVAAPDEAPRRRCAEVEVWPGARAEAVVQRSARGGHWIELPALTPAQAEGAVWEVWLDSAPLVGAGALLERLARDPGAPTLHERAGRVLALSLLRHPALLARLGPRAGEEVEALLREALAALSALQLPEGGFAPWAGAAGADLGGSLWATWALERAQVSGVPPDPAVLALAREHTTLLIERGEAPLTRQRPHPDERALAVALLARSAPRRRSILRDLEPLLALGDGLSPEAYALLVLAWADQPRRAPLRALVAPLERAAAREDGMASYPPAPLEDAQARGASARRTGALALLALVAVAPDAALTRLLAEGLVRDQGAASWLEEGLRLEALLALHEARPSPPLRARLHAPTQAPWEITEASAGWRLLNQPGQAPLLRLQPGGGAPLYLRAALRWQAPQAPAVWRGEALAVALPEAPRVGVEGAARLLLSLPQGAERAWIELPEGPGWRWGGACEDSPSLPPVKVSAFERGIERSRLRVEAPGPGIYALCLRWTPLREGAWALPPLRLLSLGGGRAASASAQVLIKP
jgi:hypothetical protein